MPKQKTFLWDKNDIVWLFTSLVQDWDGTGLRDGTGLAPKTWKRLSTVKNETP